MPDDFDTSNPAGYIRGLIAEGERPTAGLAIFREAGGRIQDSRWFELYRNVASTIADRPGALGLDPYTLPSPTDYGEWPAGKGGQFATQVQLQVYDKDLEEWITQNATYMTNDPHTPAEAEAWAIDQFDPANTGSDFNQLVMGAVAVDLWQTVPFNSGG